MLVKQHKLADIENKHSAGNLLDVRIYKEEEFNDFSKVVY